MQYIEAIIPIALFGAVFILCGLIFLKSGDFVQPHILFLLFVLIFHSAIFFREYNLEIILVVLLIIIIISLSGMKYLGAVWLTNRQFKSSLSTVTFTGGFHALIWIFSVPSIIAMCYLLIEFGGINEFVMAAKYATKEFVGLGYPKVISGLISPISLIYWIFFLKSDGNIINKTLFLVHLMIAIFWSLILFSRGTLMTHLLFMFLIYHYLVRSLSVLKLLFIGVILLLSASFLGVVRETIDLTSDSISAKEDSAGDWFKTEWSYAGLFPLERVLEKGVSEAKYGMTYLTVFTQLVPRSIWPDKPPAGGEVFTNEYASGIYDEYSHFATGLFAEAWINFGIIFGSLFASIMLVLLLEVVTKIYLSLFKQATVKKCLKWKLFGVIMYIYVLWYSMALITGEFTTIMQALLTKVSVTYLFFLLCKPRYLQV